MGGRVRGRGRAATLRRGEGAGQGKRSEQQSLPSPGDRSPLPAPRSLASVSLCSQPAALRVGPAEGWALGRVGVGRGGAGCEPPGRWRLPRAVLCSRSWTGLGQPQQLPRRRCRPRPGKSPSAMLTVRRERPLGLGVCVSVCERVCWPSRPCAATARLGLSARRLACSPFATALLPLSVVLWVPARLPLGRRARSPFSAERGSASPSRWEPGLRLPPHAAIPTRPPSQVPSSSSSPSLCPPSLPPNSRLPSPLRRSARATAARPPPPPALASLSSPVSVHPPLRRLRGGVWGGGDSSEKVRPTFPGRHRFPPGCIGASPHPNPEPPGW